MYNYQDTQAFCDLKEEYRKRDRSRSHGRKKPTSSESLDNLYTRGKVLGR
jgi:hypothetical protein